MVEITCSFCGGQGKDPLGIMSWLSTCCVCGGRGVVRVPAHHTRCGHCQGSGAIKTFTCTVCRGTGQVPVIPEPHQTCRECRDSGGDASSSPACLTCRDRGLEPQENPFKRLVNSAPVIQEQFPTPVRGAHT